jgi:hypothetical protein
MPPESGQASSGARAAKPVRAIGLQREMHDAAPKTRNKLPLCSVFGSGYERGIPCALARDVSYVDEATSFRTACHPTCSLWMQW